MKHLIHRFINQKSYTLLMMSIVGCMISCKDRSTSEVKDNSYRYDLHPVASIELSNNILDLFGSFPIEFTKEINKPMQEMKTLLTGISQTSVNSKFSTTPNYDNVEFNLISVINNKTTLEVFKKSWFTQKQTLFLNSDIQTSVGAVTDFYFNKNGLSVRTPNRVTSNSTTTYQGKELPVVKQYAEKSYQNNVPNIEEQIKETIWLTYQTELRNKITPIIRTLNEAWQKHIIQPIFHDQNTLKAFEDIRFHTSALKTKFILIDDKNVGEPPEINLNSPSIQLNVHPVMIRNFINRHIQNRFYSEEELGNMISKLPFMNLFQKNSPQDNTDKPIGDRSGILLTGNQPIQIEVVESTVNIYIQGIFVRGEEQTSEIIVKIPYHFYQYDYHAKIHIGTLETKFVNQKVKTKNLITEIYSGLRSTSEQFNVKSAILNIFPTLPLRQNIPIYKDEKTNIGHGFFGKIARIKNGWLQFVWGFEQNTLILDD